MQDGSSCNVTSKLYFAYHLLGISQLESCFYQNEWVLKMGVFSWLCRRCLLEVEQLGWAFWMPPETGPINILSWMEGWGRVMRHSRTAHKVPLFPTSPISTAEEAEGREDGQSHETLKSSSPGPPTSYNSILCQRRRCRSRVFGEEGAEHAFQTSASTSDI